MFNNALAKFGCLAIAGGLWFWVMMAGTVEERVEAVSVQVENLPENVETVPGTNPTVSLRVSGSSLRSLDPQEVRIAVELEDVDFPRTSHEIRRDEVELPEGWVLEAIEPRVVTFEFRRVTERTISVTPNLEGLPDQYEMGVRVFPPEARLRGPEEYLAGMEMLRLERISLDDVTPPGEDFRVPAEIPSGMELVEPDTNSFQVQVNVYEQVDRHEITGVPVQVTGVPDGWRAVVEPARLTVVIRGPRERVTGVGTEDIGIFVSAPDPDVGRAIELARIELPEGIELAAGFSRHQPVQIELEPTDDT